MTAADKLHGPPIPKAEKLARAMDGVISGIRVFNRQLAAQTRNELRALLARSEADAHDAFLAGLSAAITVVADLRNQHAPGSTFKALNEALGAIQDLRFNHARRVPE